LLGKFRRELRRLGSRSWLAALARRPALTIATGCAVPAWRPWRPIAAVARSRPRFERDNAASQAFQRFEDAVYDPSNPV
jgi:hypothetical protein